MASVESIFLGLAKEQFGLIIGIGVGEALAAALEPQVVAIRQSEYDADPNVAVDPLTSAAIVAEVVELRDWGAAEAQKHGIDGARFDAIVGEVLNSPGIGQLIEMARHKSIVPADFIHGLRKLKLENRWDDAVAELQTTRLSPQQLALGIVRSVVADPGLLAATLDLSGGVVPAYPEWPGNTLAEAEAGGIDKDRLRVMVGEIGLPMSAQQAASAYFRQIIKLGDYNRAILEGDTRPEWAPYILEQARQIPSSHDGIEYHLRGWTDAAGMYAQTARHGMSPADTDLLFKVSGRPLSWHQVWIGLQRGGVYDGPTGAIAAPFLKALQESNIRPEWYNLAWAQRYTYPSAFVMRALVQTGVLTQAQGEADLIDMGWRPDRAKQVSTAWAGGTTAGSDSHVSKAQTQLWSTLHRSYIVGDTDAGTAQATLGTLGVAAAVVPQVLVLWDAEKALTRRELTPTQLKKAYRGAAVNPATGTPYTKAEVIDELVLRGYSSEDAQTFVEL